MKILFLTIGQIPDLNQHSVHIDLIKALAAAGHDVSVLCSRERRFRLPTESVVEQGVRIVRLRIGNITRCSTLEKGVTTLLIEGKYKRAIGKYFGKNAFDLVIYTTPPITLAGAVKYCKKKFKCKSYLILKDIFPQNAVDLGMMSKSGLSGLLYRLFRRKEIALYRASDKIGCMSEANRRYILEQNAFIDAQKTEIFPNAVLLGKDDRRPPKDAALLSRFGIDADKPVFVYGGNLGKPQGVDFLIEALRACRDKACGFVIVGGGTEAERTFEALKDVPNVTTVDYLPHAEYEALCASCDVGMIMLDHRFTIPNYPSRVLSYLQNAMPVLACTDRASDIGDLVEDQALCGKRCYSDDVQGFCDTVDWFLSRKSEFKEMGANGRAYFERYFTTDICVEKLENFVGTQKENQ